MSEAPTIAVQSRALGDELGLPDLPIAEANAHANWLLFRDDRGLALQRHDGVRIAPDFVRGRNAARAREAALSAQPLARALGIARLRDTLGGEVTLLDATAGMGVDAWQAAALGATVTMIERHPIIHALLADALRRAHTADSERVRAIAQRVNCLRAEALEHLAAVAAKPTEHRPMVIYLDPMYPRPEGQRKRARSRKGIDALHALIPAGNDQELLDAALAAARARVVVKRPLAAPPLASRSGTTPEPVSAPNTRWDRYPVPPAARRDA